MADVTIKEELIIERGRNEQLRKEKDNAYWERNQLLLALSKLMIAGLAKHDPNDEKWEKDWMNIVVILAIQEDFTPIQMTWHIHDDELPLFSHLKFQENFVWDGHTTPEKYERLKRMKPGSGGVIAKK